MPVTINPVQRRQEKQKVDVIQRDLGRVLSAVQIGQQLFGIKESMSRDDANIELQKKLETERLAMPTPEEAEEKRGLELQEIQGRIDTGKLTGDKLTAEIDKLKQETLLAEGQVKNQPELQELEKRKKETDIEFTKQRIKSLQNADRLALQKRLDAQKQKLEQQGQIGYTDTGKPQSAEQLKVEGFTARMQNAEDGLIGLEKGQLLNKASQSDRVMRYLDFTRRADKIPFIGESLKAFQSITGTTPEAQLSPDEKKYLAYANEWVRAFLRDESGAAIGTKEFRDAYEAFFPTADDTAETIQVKADLRQKAIQSNILKTGRTESRKEDYREDPQTREYNKYVDTFGSSTPQPKAQPTQRQSPDPRRKNPGFNQPIGGGGLGNVFN